MTQKCHAETGEHLKDDAWVLTRISNHAASFQEDWTTSCSRSEFDVPVVVAEVEAVDM